MMQLTALLAELGLNIQEAHVFSTTDGFSLDVFVVDGWPYEVLFPLLFRSLFATSSFIFKQTLLPYGFLCFFFLFFQSFSDVVAKMQLFCFPSFFF